MDILETILKIEKEYNKQLRVHPTMNLLMKMRPEDCWLAANKILCNIPGGGKRIMDIQKAKERIDKEYRNRLFEPLQEKWRVLRPGEGCWLTAAWITDHLGLPTCPLSECLLGVCMYNTDDVLKIFDWIDNFAHEHGYYDEFYKVRLDQIQEEEAAHDREAMKILAQIAGMPEGYSVDTYAKKIIWGNEKGEQSMHPHDEPMLVIDFNTATLKPTCESANDTADDFHASITLDSVSGSVGHDQEYHFSGVTNSYDGLLNRLRKTPGFMTKKFDIGALASHPSLTAKRIYQYDGRHTTVEWMDGTKTTVCCEDPEKYTEWSGFCACVAKKLYGSTTKAEDMLENAKEYTAWPKKRKEIEREKIKKMCRERHDRAVMEREEKIAAKMEEMWIANEATKRMYANDSKVEVKDGAEEEK